MTLEPLAHLAIHDQASITSVVQGAYPDGCIHSVDGSIELSSTLVLAATPPVVTELNVCVYSVVLCHSFNRKSDRESLFQQ